MSKAIIRIFSDDSIYNTKSLMASDVEALSLTRELQFMRRNEAGLSLELAYLAGVCQSITGLQLEIITKFLKQIGDAKRELWISDDQYVLICKHLKEGRVGDAKSALDLCRAASEEKPKPKPNRPIVPQKIEEDISEVVRALEAEERRKEELARKESEELAKRYQEQYQREVEALAAVKGQANLLCQICGKAADSGLTLSTCGHLFHINYFQLSHG